MQSVLVYVLAAFLWSGTDRGNAISAGGNFASYDDCTAAAKAFFYRQTKPDLYAWPGADAKGVDYPLPGNINFTWRCDGYVR